VYSFGVIAWEVLEQRRPHESLDTCQISAMWVDCPAQLLLPAVTIRGGLPPADQQAAKKLQELVYACTAYEAAR
jgi:hypothetical protein